VHGAYPRVSVTADAVGIVLLNEASTLSVFAPRALEILHGEAMPKLEIDPVDPMWVLGSRELERVLAPAVRVDEHTIAVEFEGVSFHVEAWDEDEDDDECDTASVVYEAYGAEFVCFCESVCRPADVTTKGGV
jgi:hypothetical protein